MVSEGAELATSLQLWSAWTPASNDTFFPTATAHPLLDGLDVGSFPLTKLATALVAQTITRCKDEFKFHATLKKDAVETYLRDVYESLQWKKLGFSLYAQVYPEIVRDAKTGICFKDFLGDESHIWAEKLITHITEPSWTREMLKLIVKGKYSEEEYNRDMNVLFVKLHLLDPQSVIPAFQFLLNQRALPAVNLELATRNYLGGPLDHHVIKPEVETALRKPSVPLNVSRLSLDEVEIFYGVRVDEFIVTECRNIGFWSGRRPENYKMSKLKERCAIM
ncbi:uncharacterized protein LOC121378084 [Gigantopelta aegis]|uniref:uncharacterized protein LOC121378084 n=1 Tax=Gigantopelta aegis TaxID=1735272 RepID=UPI001B8873FC|nr:uncharacterized protein LOC121378084 [Gigantopelta aegis]